MLKAEIFVRPLDLEVGILFEDYKFGVTLRRVHENFYILTQKIFNSVKKSRL